MIKVEFTKYCENCPHLVPISNKTYSDGNVIITHIKCDYNDVCAGIYSYLKKQLLCEKKENSNA